MIHERASPPRKAGKNRNARRYASWTMSCASCSLRVSHRARLYAASRCGSTDASKFIPLICWVITGRPAGFFPLECRGGRPRNRAARFGAERRCAEIRSIYRGVPIVRGGGVISPRKQKFSAALQFLRWTDSRRRAVGGQHPAAGEDM